MVRHLGSAARIVRLRQKPHLLVMLAVLAVLALGAGLSAAATGDANHPRPSANTALAKDIGENIAPNPGFEDGATGWSTWTLSDFGGTSAWVGSSGIASPLSGDHAYAISNLASGCVVSDPIDVSAGQTYELTAYMRGEIDRDDSFGGVAVRTEFRGADGQVLGTHDSYSGDGTGLSTTWQKVGVGSAIVPPGGTSSLVVQLCTDQTSGWVAFDYIKLVAQGTSTNLVQNYYFGGTAHWSFEANPAFPATSIRNGMYDTTRGIYQGYGVAISNLANGCVESAFIGVRPFDTFQLHSWVRGEIDSDDGFKGLSLAVDFYEDRPTGMVYLSSTTVYSDDVGTSLSDWTQVGGQFHSGNPYAYFAKARLCVVDASGWVAFDDVELIDEASGYDRMLDPSFEGPFLRWGEDPTEDVPATSLWRSTWGTAAPHSGSYAYSVSNLTYGRVTSDFVAVSAGTEYDLYVHVRGRIDAEDSHNGLLVRAEFYDDSDTSLGFQNIYINNSLSTIDWQRVGGRFTTPVDAVKLKIRLFNYLSLGWIAFDDVELTQVTPPPPVISFGTLSSIPGEFSVSESSGSVELPVVLSGTPSTDVEVQYWLTDGTAHAGEDYQAFSGTRILKIQPPATSGGIPVPIIDDDGDPIFEGNETFSVTLSNPNGATFDPPSSNPTATVTIIDNETQPTVSIEGPSDPVPESSADPVLYQPLTISLSHKTTQPVTVTYETQDQSAVSYPFPMDFRSKQDTLTIDPGQLQGSIEVLIYDDNVYEGTQSFGVQINEAENAEIDSSRSLAVITIADDEPIPEVTLIGPTSYRETTWGPAPGLHVTQLGLALTRPSSTDRIACEWPIHIGYSTRDGTAGAADYEAPPEGAEIVIAAYDTYSSGIQIKIFDDSIQEPQGEQFTLVLSDPVVEGHPDIQIPLASPETQITILDAIMVGFSDTAEPPNQITEDTTNESAHFFTAKVTASEAPDWRNATVDYSTSSVTATESDDYVGSSGTLSIPEGQKTAEQPISIEILEDQIPEDDETFIITLSNPSPGLALGPNRTLTVTIKDGNSTVVGFELTSKTVAEGDEPIPVNILLSEPLSEPVSVHYETEDQTAVYDSDYVPISGTATIEPGSTTTTEPLEIQIISDTEAEEDETFTVRLSNPSPEGVVSLGHSTMTITIRGSEACPIPTVTLPTGG